MTNLYSAAHFSEWAWVGAKFDYELNNDSTVDILNAQIAEVISRYA
jgi:hypothetical protein